MRHPRPCGICWLMGSGHLHGLQRMRRGFRSSRGWRATTKSPVAQIKHALRFTLQNSRAAFVPPASHWAATSSNANAAPMGMRLRLKASFDISGYSAANQVILKALQQYGMIMADNGSNMYISGAPDDRWDNDDLHNLDQVTAVGFRSGADESDLYASESADGRGRR